MQTPVNLTAQALSVNPKNSEKICHQVLTPMAHYYRLLETSQQNVVLSAQGGKNLPTERKQAGRGRLFPPGWYLAGCICESTTGEILFHMAKHFLKQGQPCKLTKGPRRLVAFYFRTW